MSKIQDKGHRWHFLKINEEEDKITNSVVFPNFKDNKKKTCREKYGDAVADFSFF